MLGFNKIVHRINKEVFLFLALMGLTFLTVGLPINFMYGITISFTSVFLFLVLRLFGLRWAMLVAVLTFVFIPQDFTNIVYHGILLLEIFFVGLFFYKRRSAKMFFVDLLFWGTIGCIAVLLFYSSFLSGNSLYFQVCEDIINGLFNVFVADMLLAYVPFYKMFSHQKLSKNNISVHQFLSHVTLMAIFVPFFLSATSSMMQATNFITSYIEEVTETSINRLEELARLDSNDSNETIAQQLQGIISRNESAGYSFYITNKENDVIASNTDGIPLNQAYDVKDDYEVEAFSANILAALPKGEESSSQVERWSNGQFIYEKSLDSSSLNVVLEFPIAPYQGIVFRSFLNQLVYSLILAFFLFILVGTVSRIFMNNLRKLTVVTTGLPQKLKKLENVQWPHSYVAELRTLTRNLMVMADKIKELFQDSHTMNEKLTDQTHQLKKSEDQLHHLAFYDALTQLPNRLHFQNYVRNLIKQESTKCFAVIFIDLNQFKQINDTLGHDAGDTLLQLTADKLKKLHREQEREIFRLGGDEFVIVHNVENEDKVSSSLYAVFQEFANPFSMQDQMLFITPSVGVSMYPRDGEDLDTLVKYADIAMYISKEKGGNVAQFFDESMRNRFQEQLIIENALRQVVDCGCGFELFYQPKMKSDRITGMEALLRWNHPELGVVPPSSFIPVAEEIGLILQIDEWALYQACKQNKQWQDQGLLKVPVSVNISAKHFQQDLLVSLIEKVLAESGMEPKYLKLEITESVFIKDPEHVAIVIEKLKSLGVLISIDDFGKGYSSLNHLLELPIDEVKIDRLFVEGIDLDPKKGLLVNSILDIANGLHLNIVAEGVETEWEQATLEEIGDFELQGYLFSRPVDKDGMEKFLSKKVSRHSEYYSEN
ncbi:EAL domain-containing protein [Radiobacillus kanasensis]|uniref:putative bifunctional diguanylate cyclase/phosphodiesterase n=1 Tax=Radiobacillus kanasensis TaxID=2844358 RepID=UPI001E3AF3CB|nr:bifunctional diguanylate cyclase/phosphodiesterase [Radiobacillus kanasensis]UFU00268.1 EAL domain-containing protein [Radiobacillus kanasensis]